MVKNFTFVPLGFCQGIKPHGGLQTPSSDVMQRERLINIGI